MELTVGDVAQLCKVGENTVFTWLQEDGLPAGKIDGSYRVNAAELLEWATSRKLIVSPAIFRKLNGDSIGHAGLAEAMEAGGVIYDVPGDDRQSVLAAVVEDLPLPKGFARQSLVQLLMARQRMGSTALGDGIAIPHPRTPVVLAGAKSVVRLCFLSRSLDFGASDGKPVDTLFLMICPTVHDHLQQLARLAGVLRDDSFRGMLREKPPRDVILKEVRRVEESFRGST